MKPLYILLAFLTVHLTVFSQSVPPTNKNRYYSRTDTTTLHVTNAQWKKILSPELYAVSRERATEKAFTGKFWNSETRGMYYCAVCGNALFRSTAKFASTCGWPSFFDPVRNGSVTYRDDHSNNLERTEVLCGRCGSHLGHLFNDGPAPTHKRFCMNSVALDFEPGNPATPVVVQKNR